MAIVFLPLNGIGLGHVSRAFTLATGLLDAGERPVIFSQGCYPAFMLATIPGLSVGTLYDAAAGDRAAIAADVEAYARRTLPFVVIEDTHPAPIQIASDVARILIVRPTRIEHMRDLRAGGAATFHACLVADHPTSPTWPFSPEETAEIEGWHGWSFLGPVFRPTTHRSRASIRRKYGLARGTPAYVFTMGGGGSQSSPADEGRLFGDRALEIATRLRRQCPESRLIFVRGPLSPDTLSLPPLFEDHAVEPDMPSLLAVATGAIVRPGHNTLWECLAGGTPFIAISGETFAEPVAERLRRLRENDLLLLPGESDRLLDARWRHSFRRRSVSRAARWSMARVTAGLQSAIQAIPQLHPPPVVARASWPRRPTARGGTLLLRVDDVTEATDELIAILELCRVRGLSVSLDVIPYLTSLDQSALDRLAGGVRYEVAQHGYDHLPRRRSDGRKTEFSSDVAAQTAALAAGAAIVRRRFGASFRGGFSAPFDAFPDSLCATWAGLGGRYASTVHAESDRSPIPVVRLTADPWDWSQDAPQPFWSVLNRVSLALNQRDCAGLVLHPQLLRRPGEADRLADLLDDVLLLGCRTRLISEVAVRA
jgi:UDP:flavonoid glycosyltransferase YjiC (YdhE family)